MTPQDALAAELKGLEEELLVPAVRKSTRSQHCSPMSSLSSAVPVASIQSLTSLRYCRRNRPSARRPRTSRSPTWRRMLHS
jgi:hypothetical protein